MDGVLIDSEPLWKIAMEDVFRQIGSSLTKQDFQKTVGLRLDEVIRFWHQVEGWTAEPKAIEEAIVAQMVRLIQANPQPLPGVRETLHFLKEQNIQIGLATSSYAVLIETVLNALEIDAFFDMHHSAEKEQYGKPHPAVYLHVAHTLKVDPTSCLVIEDSLNGIIAGKAARMKVVCIPEKTHFPEPKLNLADYHYNSMVDLLNDWKK